MSLKDFRENIDEIDEEILSLILKRLDICKKIGIFKNENNMLIEDKKREEEILDRIKKSAGEFSPAVENIFKNIILNCKNVQ